MGWMRRLRSTAGFPPPADGDAALPPGAPSDDPMPEVVPAPGPQAEPQQDMTMHHCCRCGSGGIVGGSDGSIECGFCKFVFKVYAQPTHPFMPQTVNGQPYQIPGQQPINNEPLPAAGTAPAPAPPVPAAPGSATPGAVGGGLEQFRVDAPAAPPQPVQAGLRSVQSSLLVTHSGVAVPLDSYIAHLAIRHADDPGEAIQQVRARRG